VITMRVCFIGDSFVNGTGDPDCLGWVGRVCAEACRAGHDLTCYNLGIRRDTSANIRLRWREEADRRLVAGYDGRLVFSFGVNDATQEDATTRVSIAESCENARAILAEARASHPVLMVGPPTVADTEQNLRIANLSRALARICDELLVPYLEICAALQDCEVWMAEVSANDGSDPGAGGYAELARRLSAWPAWQAWFTRSVIT
jgi:lysophospholipase L1-like esterase